MNASITIARNGAELGSWSPVDVQKMLASGVLTKADYFFTEGMTDWAALDRFVLPQDPVKTYPVTFGGGMSVDKIGFVRAGQIKVSGNTVEITGMKLWPAIARVGCFVVGAPILWSVMGTITAALPENAGALMALIRVCFGLFTLIGVPLVVMMLIRAFCASPGSVILGKGDLSDVIRSGKRISFHAQLKSGKRRALFQAKDEIAASDLEQRLHI